MKWKIFTRWLKIAVLLYCIAGIVLYYVQDDILFHPEQFARNGNYGFPDSSVEVNIPYDRTTNLNIVEFKTRDTVAKGVVLYFHGNRKNVSWYARFAAGFTDSHFEVWMLDYPGFGKSTGKFAELKLYDYALQVYRLARKRFKPSEIIIFGKSFGSCLAAQLASVRDCRYLVLETPCYSLASLVTHYFPIYPVSRMLHYRFPNYEYLLKVTAPVVIFHGTDDGIVPYSNAARLKASLKAGDEFITIPGGSHNDLAGFPIYRHTL